MYESDPYSAAKCHRTSHAKRDNNKIQVMCQVLNCDAQCGSHMLGVTITMKVTF